MRIVGSFGLRALSSSLVLTALTVACGDDKLAALPVNEPLAPTCADGSPMGEAGCPGGRIVGHVCDHVSGTWVVGAVAGIYIGGNMRTAASDANGEYVFEDVPAGTYLLHVASAAYTNDFWVTVVAHETAAVGPSECVPTTEETGTVQGRICGGSGYWLSGARVFVDLGSGDAVETGTDGDGFFTLAGVPAGGQTVQVTKGSFATSFTVTVVAGETTVLPEPVCIPPTTHMAVVTGVYDSVEDVLGGLGFPIRQTYTNSTTPTVSNAAGNVDIIDGTESSFWIDSFLADPAWMAEYDIIFLNCGVNDDAIATGSSTVGTAVTNLQAYVAQGHSVYASDWASEIVRIAFPGRIAFVGDGSFGAARVGNSNDNLAATAVDAGLIAALGRTALTLTLNLPQWVVMRERAAQPADLRVLVKGDVQYCSNMFCVPMTNLADSPLVVHFPQGEGRVLFTSCHNEAQTSNDLRDVLNYIIFEL